MMRGFSASVSRVALQLARDDFGVVVGRLVRREIDEMDEHRAALDVAEELVAEAVTFVRAFDEAGDVGDDEGLVVVGADDAEVRDERGEGIVGDLRLGGADDGDQRRLAGVRQSDEADVGDQLQLDEQLALLAGVAVLREARRLARGGGEVLVAPPAAPALGDENALAVVRRGRRSVRRWPCRGRRSRSAARSSTSSPSWPEQFEPMPCWPRPAFHSR